MALPPRRAFAGVPSSSMRWPSISACAPASRPASAGAMISFTFATARAHVEAAERGAAVAQVHRLAAAGRGAGRRDRAADDAAGERDLDLDRRPAA